MVTQPNAQRQPDDGERRYDLVNMAKVARAYHERGWKVVPVPMNKKHPRLRNWQLIDFSERIDSHFGYWTNIGIQEGPVSDGLTDVDCDCRAARELAPYFLSHTDATFGRDSAPEAHWIYYSDIWKTAKQATIQFIDPMAEGPNKEEGAHGAVLVELRVGRLDKHGEVVGAMSMFPPSRHPSSGERVRWFRDGDPSRPGDDVLRRGVGMVAAGALLVNHYPAAAGKHHTWALVLGGWLARAGWDENRIAHFVEAVAKVAHDPDWQDRVTSAKSAVARLREGKEVAGFPRMREVFGDRMVDAMAEWLGIGGGGTARRRVVPHTVPAKPVEPRTIDEVLAVYNKWLKLDDSTPVLAALGTIAANMLPGDPVWLGLIAPPSSAKTEILLATTQLSTVIMTGTVTGPAALLSGTPVRQRHKQATGGLLRQIGDFGILMIKDFGSILSQHRDARAEVLAALREIYDGQWVRHLGAEGGRQLAWSGKMGLLFASTTVIDEHYAVIAQLGDRFLTCRLAPDVGQLRRALKHRGDLTKIMRAELAEAVSGLFARELREPRPLSDKDVEWLERITELAVRLRGAVSRDHFSRELQMVYGAEGPARMGMALERLLAGLDMIGVDRKVAYKVVHRVTFDSVPPLKLKTYRYLLHRAERGLPAAKTKLVANALRLPTTTTLRLLQELAAYDVIGREIPPDGGSGPDRWETWPNGRRPSRS